MTVSNPIIERIQREAGVPELIDGGFTTWTQQVLSNIKERLLISGLGIERLCSQFRATPAGVS